MYMYMYYSSVVRVVYVLNQSGGDLSSFAMPHLDGSDRVGQQMELVQSVDSMQGERVRGREGGIGIM